MNNSYAGALIDLQHLFSGQDISCFGGVMRRCGKTVLEEACKVGIFCEVGVNPFYGSIVLVVIGTERYHDIVSGCGLICVDPVFVL